MEWEVYPESIYEMVKQFSKYKPDKPLIVTENGAAFPDVWSGGNEVHDERRTTYLQTHIEQVLRAKNEGIDVRGYFVWTLMDNFEWAEGFKQRFGLIHIDYETLKRTVKNSGWWYKEFLENK
jgi:beta-glucosidase